MPENFVEWAVSVRRSKGVVDRPEAWLLLRCSDDEWTVIDQGESLDATGANFDLALVFHTLLQDGDRLLLWEQTWEYAGHAFRRIG